MEEARLLQEAIQEYTASLHIIWEALAASPSEEELLDVSAAPFHRSLRPLAFASASHVPHTHPLAAQRPAGSCVAGR